jgi:hypothetical protein
VQRPEGQQVGQAEQPKEEPRRPRVCRPHALL